MKRKKVFFVFIKRKCNRNNIKLCLINTKNTFFLFGRWLLPEKFRFCLKNNGFARIWGEGGHADHHRRHLGTSAMTAYGTYVAFLADRTATQYDQLLA